MVVKEKRTREMQSSHKSFFFSIPFSKKEDFNKEKRFKRRSNKKGDQQKIGQRRVKNKGDQEKNRQRRVKNKSDQEKKRQRRDFKKMQRISF